MSIVAFVYRSVRISIHIFTSSMNSNVTTSTRINSTKWTYIHLCLFHSKPVQHVQYSTWCQNRGCICISSRRRTYRLNPAIPAYILIILQILQDRIFYKEEKISKKRYQAHFSLQIQCFLQDFQCVHMQFNKFSVIPCKENYSTYRINSSTRNLQEILQLQNHPMHIDTRHPPATVPHASKHSTWQNKAPGSLQYTQASSNSTHRNSILSCR